MRAGHTSLLHVLLELVRVLDISVEANQESFSRQAARATRSDEETKNERAVRRIVRPAVVVNERRVGDEVVQCRVEIRVELVLHRREV